MFLTFNNGLISAIFLRNLCVQKTQPVRSLRNLCVTIDQCEYCTHLSTTLQTEVLSTVASDFLKKMIILKTFNSVFFLHMTRHHQQNRLIVKKRHMWHYLWRCHNVFITLSNIYLSGLLLLIIATSNLIHNFCRPHKPSVKSTDRRILKLFYHLFWLFLLYIWWFDCYM